VVTLSHMVIKEGRRGKIFAHRAADNTKHGQSIRAHTHIFCFTLKMHDIGLKKECITTCTGFHGLIKDALHRYDSNRFERQCLLSSFKHVVIHATFRKPANNVYFS
jgi:hypothetical protein